jgi:hypothetical protein
MTEEDEEFNRIEREAAMRMEAVAATVKKRKWVGLTKSDLREIIVGLKRPEDLYKAIEAKLKEKNEL